MRFHLIDRILACDPGRSVRGRKLTSLDEEYWEETDTGPVMPPALVLESLCQAGTWLIMVTTDRRKRAALLSLASVDFRADVHPGDVLELIGTVDSMTDEMAVISGRVEVNGRSVLEARDIMCALIDASDLEDPDASRRMQSLLTREEKA